MEENATLVLTYVDAAGVLHRQEWRGVVRAVDQLPEGVVLSSLSLYAEVDGETLEGIFGRGWAGTLRPVT